MTQQRGIAMTRSILIAAAVLSAAAALPASAQVNLEMNKITCGDWLGYDATAQNFVKYWMSGYYAASRNDNVLDFKRLQTRSAKVMAYCKKNKKATLPTAIKNST